MHGGYHKSELEYLLMDNDIDHVVLSEIGQHIDDIEKNLGLHRYTRIGVTNQYVYHFSRHSPSLYRTLHESNRMIIVEYDSVLWEKIIIVGLHLPSKLRRNNDEQRTIAEDCVRIIIEAEERCGHTNTVIVGDFNLAPYEMGMVSHRAFHSVMCPEVANTKQRTFNGEKREFFYNPTWRLYGKYDNVLGTYKYHESGLCEYYWYMFDQVIYRPSMIDYIPIDNIEILTETRYHLLYDEGNKEILVSDHLPIKFTIKPV